MLAKLLKNDNGFSAVYERQYSKPVEFVWALLVNNENFKHWMDHLEITDLSKGGNINFNYNDGSGKFEKFIITDYVEGSVLEFEWGEDIVRFEVLPSDQGSKLVMTEFINNLTDHTPKDLAGWHVCLLRFSNLVNDLPDDVPEKEWEKWYEEYKKLVEEVKS
ncbi:SRPBCC domain-containing protein [Ureibacillus endophyticus]|uniref:Activator of Hsp90 ATPase 1 family protein n=1 Tax=Ureibacillus endophyticus TaxID=1978490 RepID=A0A494YU06_9BACL|nr:SRPBCC domain-containing protein [Lysinibacillus endophyticus]RKQ13601.1 activator of Hsp90 ATPase 1 family protein [Lysinibacillus endophyticus]